MEAHDLPVCPCGTKKWSSGGASISPTLAQFCYSCASCLRPGQFISSLGGAVFFTPTQGISKFPDVVNEWFEISLLPAWRVREEEIKAVQQLIEDRWRKYACDEVGVPHGTEYNKIPKTKCRQWNNFWELLQSYPPYLNPFGFEKPVIPPQLPLEITAFILSKRMGDGRVWKKVSHKESRSLPVPSDPIRVRHDAFYKEVFADTRRLLGVEFTPEEVRNEYCGAAAQPWFKFKLGRNTVVVGPRKRVTAIKVTSPGGFNTRDLRAAALAIPVTYMANGLRQDEVVVAQSVEVHAWDKAQLLRFLNIIGLESVAAIPA